MTSMPSPPGFARMLPSRRWTRVRLALGFALLIVAVPCNAAVLTHATFSESLTGGGASAWGPSFLLPESIDLLGTNATGHAAATGGSHPSIVLDLAVSEPTRVSGLVTIEYQVAVVPLPGAPIVDFVPVHIGAVGNVGIRTTGNYNGYMNAYVFAGLDGDNAGAHVGLTGARSDDDSFAIDRVLDFVPNLARTVRMSAQGEVRPPPFPHVPDGDGEAFAFVDPVFTIDAAFASRNFFQLSFSAGILPAVVPLPPALPILMSACGFLLAARARRRTRGLK